MIVKFYKQPEDTEAVAEVDADILDVGYTRKGRVLSDSELRGTIELTQKNTGFGVNSQYVKMLHTPFYKIELVNGDDITDIADGIPYICTSISTKSPISDFIPEEINTVITLKELFVG